MNQIEKWENNCSVLRDPKFRSKYTLLSEIIGEGSFGTVVTAQCKISKEKRAIKAIRRIDKISMLSIELKILAELGGHFNIVKFYDFFHVLGSVAIIMEHFEHCTVGELVMHSRKNPKFPLSYFRNLMIALNYLHLNGYVHRDIKLSNFLYSSKKDEFRLVDFGLATIDRSKNEVPREKSCKTLKIYSPCELCQKQSAACMICKSKPKRDLYHVVGTPGVRAPELLLGIGICSPPVDIFSAGLCLLSLLCLKHPFFMPKNESDNILNLARLLGSETLEKMALTEGLRLTISEKFRPADFNKLILCLRFGFETVQKDSEITRNQFCEKCATSSFNNTAGVCFCRKDFDSNKYSTEGINSDLISLYIDLLYNSLEPDRFKRYSANNLLRMIEFYDSREKFKPNI